MQEKQLPGNLHFKQMNPYISMEDTPFYRIDKSCYWKALVNEEGNEIPRRAGVSSFGIGGSNAHIVIEECMQKVSSKRYKGQVIIPFSAKTQESLFDIMKEYLNYFESVEMEQVDWNSLAYTLQVGRCPMEVRKAFIVHNIEELKVALHAFLEKPVFSEEKVGAGQVEASISKWIAGKQYEEIAKYWEAGGSVDWKLLYLNEDSNEAESMPHRLHLPTYAFCKKSYWLESDEKSNQDNEKNMVEVVHPLIEKNTSDFFEQKFTNRVTTDKFYVKDHTIDETCILPGVITIEMARAAYMQSNSDVDLEKDQIEIRDLIWRKSIAIEKEPVEVGMSLYLESESEAAFELYLTEDEIVCSEGRIKKVSREEMHIELEEVKKNCTNNRIVAREFYQQFRSFGMEYGTSFRGMKEVHIGTNEAIAKLCIPNEVENTLESYMLHPSMLDASLQTCSSLFEQTEETLILPYKIGRVIVRANCTSEMWAYVKKVKGESIHHQTYDIELCDSTGKVCVSFRNVQFIQALHKTLGLSKKKRTLMFEKVWKEQEACANQEMLQVDKKVLILVEPSKEMLANTSQMTEYQCIILNAKGDSFKEQYKSNALRLFHPLKKLMEEANDKSVLIQLLYVEKDERYLYGGLAAMLKTASEENPAVQSQVIVLEDWDVISVEKVKAEACVEGSTCIRYADGRRYVSEWEQVAQNVEESDKTSMNKNGMHCWKEEGVYLITGGLGGIGLEVVREIQRYTKKSVLVLTGRSSWDTVDAVVKSELEEMKHVTIDYVQADVSSKEETIHLME